MVEQAPQAYLKDHVTQQAGLSVKQNNRSLQCPTTEIPLGKSLDPPGSVPSPSLVAKPPVTFHPGSDGFACPGETGL